MNTPDKCPHCGSIRVEGREYACGFIFREGVKNNPRTHECLLNCEVFAHAATKRELGAIRRRLSGEETESCPLCAETRGTWESQNVPMCHVCTLESTLEATKRELAQASAECGIAHDQRRDEAHRAEKAEARVRDLEAMRHAALELAQYASYAEIVGRVLLNREQIREWSDKVFKLNLDLGEAMGGSK